MNSFVAGALLVGLLALVSASYLASAASADVDTHGGLEPVSPTTKSGLHESSPLVTKTHDGKYKCSSAYPYSTFQASAFGLAIGNCKAGWTFEDVDYGGPNSEGAYTYGGYAEGTLSGCGWIENSRTPEKLSTGESTHCGNGTEVTTPESAFLEKYNGEGVGQSPHDGYFVVNKVACEEYANYRPWSSGNVETEALRSVPAYETNGSGAPALKWRYTTKYASTDGSGKYVMVRDERVSGVEGNWVFVPRSCLPATLPENESERNPPPPTAVTGSATNVGTTTATLSANVNPNGVDTKYFFEYGTTEGYGSYTTTRDAGAGTETVSVPAEISGLSPYTTYYFRIVASSATGETFGNPNAFKTQAIPPTVATQSALGVQETTATLHGEVNPNGAETHYYFQYGTTTSYGNTQPALPGGEAGSSTVQVPESTTITGLEPGITYHYRLVASNAGGTVGGSDYVLTTHRPTVALKGTNTDLLLSSVWNHNTEQGMATSTSPSIAALPGGGYDTAFQNTLNDLSVTYSNGGGVNTILGMAKGTSPSIAVSSGGGYEVAAEANSDVLWTYSSSTGTGTDTEQGMVAGTSPSITALPVGGYDTAFQNNNGDLSVTYSSGGGVNTSLGMAKGTSPSIAALPGGGYVVAYQSGSDLWIYSSSSGTATNTEQGMAAGTSPSVVALPGGGYDTAFQNVIDDLSVTYSKGGGVNTSLGMYKNTSPSIAAAASGEYEVAIAGNGDELWTYSSSTETGASSYESMSIGASPSIAAISGGEYDTAFQNGSDLLVSSGSTSNTYQGMSTGTSPSIAALPGGGYDTAFQNSGGDLSVTYSNGGGVNTILGMAKGTSPSIAVSSGGGYEVAAEANSDVLWTYSSSTETGTDTEQGMASGTSPSVTALPGGGYDTAFQNSINDLSVTYSSGGGANTSLGMAKGTSPSIAALPGGGYVVAYQSGGDLWIYSSSSKTATNTDQGMLAGTSPSIAVLQGGEYDTAFQNNISDLSVTYSKGGGVNTSLSMEIATSPSIAVLPRGGYAVAIHAGGTHGLEVYSSTGAVVNTYPAMLAGTSPSIVE